MKTNLFCPVMYSGHRVHIEFRKTADLPKTSAELAGLFSFRTNTIVLYIGDCNMGLINYT